MHAGPNEYQGFEGCSMGLRTECFESETAYDEKVAHRGYLNQD